MDNKMKLCITCLSSGRRLISFQEIQPIMQELNLHKLTTTAGGVCWECKSIMKKMQTFKVQVQIAQDALTRNIKFENIKSLTSLSTKINTNYNYEYINFSDPLKNSAIQSKTEIIEVKEEIPDMDYIDNNTSDFDDKDIEKSENVYVDTLKKSETINIHSEKRINDKSVYNVDISGNVYMLDCKIAKNSIKKVDDELYKSVEKSENVYSDTIKSKIKRKKKKKYTNSKVEEGKFIKVEFTDEEMTKNREEKRSHPNFKKIPYKCDSCVIGFVKEDKYHFHMEKKHNENLGKYTCDVCLIRFPNTTLVQRHRQKHYITYKCLLCKHESSELWSASNHTKVKHKYDEVNSIHCTQCDAVLKTPKDLEDHVQAEHTLFCNLCGAKFKRKNTLRKHKALIHTLKRQFICDICSKTFKTKSRLETHIVKHNAGIAKKLAYCQVCDIQYKNIYVYRNHMKYSANHSERIYSCPKCNKNFASKVYYKRHFNFYHLKKSPFHCEICDKLFISEWRLKNHRQKHHGLSRSRDHTCNTCGKKFYTISTLRGHQLTHSEQRTYMCEDCGDTFKQRPALYTHSRLVHNVKARCK